jgi:multimeric flavodoxin WrbA
MKIISFVGSPRKNGNTAWVVNEILEAAKAKGAETEAFYSGELDIKPCRGCLACHAEGSKGCVIRDEMQKIYEEFETADALVLASPVYMGEMTGQAKVFMDRLFATISPRFSPHYKARATKKKLLLVFTQGNPDGSFFKDYFEYTKRMFEMLEFDAGNVVVVTGMREKKASDEQGLAQKLAALGAGLAE